jgi:hypothetical protein
LWDRFFVAQTAALPRPEQDDQEALENAMLRYVNKAITTAEVIVVLLTPVSSPVTPPLPLNHLTT